MATDGRCPICGKKLTIGVLHRVEDLADREEGFRPTHARPFESIVPLAEVIAASIGFTPASAKVQTRYNALLHHLGPEFYILRQAPLEDISHASGPSVAEGIRRMRAGEVTLSPGYDGEYGKIHLLDETQIQLNRQVTSVHFTSDRTFSDTQFHFGYLRKGYFSSGRRGQHQSGYLFGCIPHFFFIFTGNVILTVSLIKLRNSFPSDCYLYQISYIRHVQPISGNRIPDRKSVV